MRKISHNKCEIIVVTVPTISTISPKPKLNYRKEIAKLEEVVKGLRNVN